MIFVFSIFISFCIAFLSVVFVFKNHLVAKTRLLLNLSFPIAIGISSILFIIFNLLGFNFYFILVVEISIAVFLFLKIYHSLPEILLKEFSLLSIFQENILFILLFAIYIYSWLMNVGIFYFDSIKEPHGLWDAWSFWNMKAKFISRNPNYWNTYISQLNSEDFHGDYPLLQSAFIAKCWILLKNETVWVPIFSAFIFTFCTIGLLATSIKYFTAKHEGLIAGLILFCTPFYITLGDSQYADVTVGFFFLASLVLVAFADKFPDDKKYFLITAGATSAMAAWSKNEGLLFLISLFVSRAIAKFKHPYSLFNELKFIFLGALPILFLIIYYKISVAPTNDLLKSHEISISEKLVDWERYKFVGTYFYEKISSFGEWIINPWWLFLFVMALKGVTNKNNTSYGFVLITLMLIGYFYSYIISYHDLQFHLSTSLHRLFFQLFPSFIFLFFLTLKKENI